MSLIANLERVEAHLIEPPLGLRMLAVAALGIVPTTGWTHPRLSPRFYADAPPDGLWDFDFIADPPAGVVAEVLTPVGAAWVGEAPTWCRGVRVHARHNALESLAAPATRLLRGVVETRQHLAVSGRAIVTQTLASWDDSFQPTGTVHWSGWPVPTPHIEMKKLHHDMVLIVEGPDRERIQECLRQAAAAGLIAGIVAACATGGMALEAAVSAFLSALGGCLGDAYAPQVNDRSHWIYWDT